MVHTGTHERSAHTSRAGLPARPCRSRGGAGRALLSRLGPRGQGVNTADSRVQLSLDLGSTSALNDKQRERALSVLRERLTGTVLTITAAETRSQRRNRAAARERLGEILRAALTPPIPRRATKPTRASKLRRLDAKKRRSELKARRRRPDWQ